MLHSAAALTLVGDFHAFAEIGRTALLTSLAQLDVAPEHADEVLQELGRLDPYPDAERALDLLQEAGVPVYALTNAGRVQAENLLESAGLRSRIGHVWSVEDVRAYKPHPDPYRHVASTLEWPIESFTLVAAHGWDVLGARAAGMSAIWVDRLERRWPFPTAEPPSAPDLVAAVELALRGSP